MDDLDSAVRKHCELFNASVNNGDWTPFLATFTDDARMILTGRPIPPIEGRQALAAAYAQRPPTDTMTVLDTEALDEDTVRVRFDWDHGGAGTMVVRWEGGQVAEVQIS